ncbi:MAG: FtsX-like permease family protein, partial [Defluviitaleaceae bacterium]|nr:FtsX-like permease family protein [Defluviitaleaceae bacterium]
MELLKEIAKDRLVIMVTHNAALAGMYSTRIIKLLDGRVTDDSSPYRSGQEKRERARGKRKKISMSFTAALALSYKNLLTKKARTFLTAFAGSIGIIGIALILSLSNGMQTYVDNLERDTLSTYPLEISSTSMDMGGMLSMRMNMGGRENMQREPGRVYANNIMSDMVSSVTAQIHRNDLARFKEYVGTEAKESFERLTNSIQYGYDIELNIYKNGGTNGVYRVNPSDFLSGFGMGAQGGIGGMDFGIGGGVEIFSEMIDNPELLGSQYDVLAGMWPNKFDELVLVVNGENEINDMMLYALGVMDPKDMEKIMGAVMRGEELPELETDQSFSYEELLALSFGLVLNIDYYVKENGSWTDMREDEIHVEKILEDAVELKIVGIVKPNENAAAASISGTVGYTAALTDYAVKAALEAEIVREQLAKPDVNVFTGEPFAEGESYESNAHALSIADLNNPSSIKFYPTNFNAKQDIEDLIADYNAAMIKEGEDGRVINYTDIVGLLTSSISGMINIVSYVLIAFVAVSLVVSSIMIAIITYISVLERTKEIGILRSIGASKKDITRVFNAETIIEGFVAGVMGIAVTALLIFPINAIINAAAGISGLAKLPPAGAAMLVVISVLLSVAAGFIPSKAAAKKDPVAALRTE